MLRLALPALVLALTGCTAMQIEKPRDAANINPPEVWREATSGNNAKVATGWLSDFDDKKMSALVREAVANNNNLKASAFRLQAAKEGTIVGRSQRLPSLNASTSANRSYIGNGGQPGFTRESYGLSLNAAWEADLWGRLRDLDYATRADYDATLADFRSARLSLAINTARGWTFLTETAQQLVLAERTLDDFRVSLRLIDRQYQASVLRAVDVQLGRNNVAAAERNLLNRRLQRDEAARALEVLLGRYPSAELKSSLDLARIKKLNSEQFLEGLLGATPKMREDVPTGLPLELLNRRPDLAGGQARIYASARRTDAARKDLLPSLRINGSASNSSDQFRRAMDPAWLTWAIASSLAQTIYQGGAPSAQARAALARHKAVISDYVQDVLIAFREVESALERERSLRGQEVFLIQEVQQASLAEKQSERDLGLGLEGSSVLEILEAQRRAVNARGSLIQLRTDRIQNRLDLHLALGGDYETLAK